jgi:hypothetical protein
VTRYLDNVKGVGVCLFQLVPDDGQDA